MFFTVLATPTALPIIRNFSTFSSIKTVWMALRYVLYVQDIFSKAVYFWSSAVSAFGSEEELSFSTVCSSYEEKRKLWMLGKARRPRPFPSTFKAQIMILIFFESLDDCQVLWSPWFLAVTIVIWKGTDGKRKQPWFSINDLFIWDWDPFTIFGRPGTEAHCSLSEDELSLKRNVWIASTLTF